MAMEPIRSESESKGLSPSLDMAQQRRCRWFMMLMPWMLYDVMKCYEHVEML